MLEVNAEVVFLPERLLYWCKKVFITVYSFTTLAAYEVIMVSFLCIVVGKMVA
jgi:hypothetical protein